MFPRLKMGLPRQKLSISRFLRNFCQDSRGNTLILAAAAIFPIAAIIGSGLDMSRAYTAQSKLQNACDAAALAARRSMAGSLFSEEVRIDGERFFDFNFPSSTMNARNVTRTVAPDSDDASIVTVTASADIPTAIMGLFGKEIIPISVSCAAEHDTGHNDIVLVLDVTASMKARPTGATSGPAKIDMLRSGAMGLFRSLNTGAFTRTRYGIIPYSMVTNVARSLRNRDILYNAYHLQCPSGVRGDCAEHETVPTPVHIDDTRWAQPGHTSTENIRNFRDSGDGCVEERPSIGNRAHPIEISTTVTQDDIDVVAQGRGHQARRWGRFDRRSMHLFTRNVCPSEATRLRTYDNEVAFQDAIDSATAIVTGNTYHDIGMIWGARFLSSTGMFRFSNPDIWDGTPVAKHIVFLTDGVMCPGSGLYSAFGVDDYEHRIVGPETTVTGCADTLSARHSGRFLSSCETAKAMGMTIWVIALDVYEIDHIRPCATSEGHFFTSDGTDLEDVFSSIGQEISHLRLSR